MTRVPFVDLRPVNHSIREGLDAAIERVRDRSSFILGEEVERFEEEFAQACGVRHAIGAGNGLDALQLALRALEIGPGDEVITTTHTVVATVNAIALVGARPVLVDARADSLLMDPVAVESAITPRTRAIIAVHLYGRLVDMTALAAVADRHQIPLVEDAAHAHGAMLVGRRAGALGMMGCFSFYPTKNLGALGDAGAVTTDDRSLADRIRMLRNYGTRERYEHPLIGINSRLDELQAAILRVKLPMLDDWNADRRRQAKRYREELAGSVEMPSPPATDAGLDHVHHLFPILHADRDAFRDRLLRRGVETSVHYPIPVHEQGAYQHLGYAPGTFPVAEQAARRLISLPMYWGMTDEQQSLVIDAVKAG